MIGVQRGMPNFRAITHLPLAGTAQPNVTGIKHILDDMCVQGGRVLWINLREEPVIFIQQEPFLLRDYAHPFRCLPEFHTGMTPERSESVGCDVT